jgi:hypothetical protein
VAAPVTRNVQKLIDRMIEAAIVLVPQAAQIVNAEAKKKLTVKGHVVTGNLRRSGFVSEPRVSGGVVSATISFPPEYAIYVEMLPDGGYLYEAMFEQSDRVRAYIADGMRKVVRG